MLSMLSRIDARMTSSLHCFISVIRGKGGQDLDLQGKTSSDLMGLRWFSRINTVLIFLIGVMGLVSCSQDESGGEGPIITKVNIALDSVQFQKVYNLIDQGEQDSLLLYLSHPDPSFRVLAIRGFSGMMDEAYIDTVGSGILDPIPEVRRITAYVLGQSYHERAVPYLLKVFQNQDSLGIDPMTFRYALEGMGKCADSSFLSHLAGITTYQPTDTLLMEGQCLGLLKMAERGFSDPTATARMVKYLKDTVYSRSVRLIAANYLAVENSNNREIYRQELIESFEAEENPEIRMFIGTAIGKSGSEAESWIRRTLRIEKDDRVCIALLRGCTALPLAVRHRIWAGTLRDQNSQVARTAAGLIMEYGSSVYSDTYANWAFGNYAPEVYARLLGAGNKYVSNVRFRQMVQDLIFRRMRSTKDPFLKSDFIMAAGQRMETARHLIAYDAEETPPVVRISIIEALIQAANAADRLGSRERQFLIERWESGDVAALAVLSPFFAKNKMWFPELTADKARWTAQSTAISMPGGIEARMAVDKARQQLFGIEYDPLFYRKDQFYTHPVDWKLYEQLSDQPRAEIFTSAGAMAVELFKKEAPATVLNFIQLAESGYYDGKLIHRVVPNFVLQGGGNRGDGYGSMDYTIRSEVGPQYYDQSGILGMASAGLHTESQQWFVTLRPALHLNGRYTQFARVVSGQDILPLIRRGDQIETIKIHR
ncbi:peptidylprolyl isomerase [Membranicola marinus]|uniref:peptidylprolyl isomerase n=1 Tax=Membranihabitans marinus TaxID=1227546 RepID=A0A953HP82_9BACT|nr:peptidylprolyl isomerase [Membranihabitans marinus]MBY5958268.1 peptidylprolyl isomerase [Membranihabitans marinus]